MATGAVSVHLSFRARLMTIVGATGVAFLLVILVSWLIGLREERKLAEIERRLVPKLALGPLLDAELGALTRGLQDAAGAQDPEMLAETRSLRDRLLATLASAPDAMSSADLARVRTAIEDYFETAYDVAKRLVQGDRGEASVRAMGTMQEKLSRARGAAERDHAPGSQRADLGVRGRARRQPDRGGAAAGDRPRVPAAGAGAVGAIEPRVVAQPGRCVGRAGAVRQRRLHALDAGDHPRRAGRAGARCQPDGPEPGPPGCRARSQRLAEGWPLAAGHRIAGRAGSARDRAARVAACSPVTSRRRRARSTSSPSRTRCS